MNTSLNRRRVLRGMLGGSAVTVALPFLDCFLNNNGTALAATGAPLPVRFGTWFWGCGMTPTRWVPKTTGTGYEVPVELKAIAPFKEHVNILSGFAVQLEGRTNFPHISGNLALRTGTAPTVARPDGPSLDVLISDSVGTASRFRSLELSPTGDTRHSYSFRSATATNPGEPTAMGLYTRVFGPEFQDPNAADFKPDPRAMVQKSVLSGVADQRDELMKKVGAADRARLDQYFTSLRQIEQQFELQLQKPPKAEACAIPSKYKEAPTGLEIEQVMANHKVMAQLLAMALACNQTKVFNVVFSDSASNLRRAGSSATHHQLTHEEQIDEKLGYQKETTYFVERSMDACGDMIKTLAEFKEGAGSLLDNCLVFAHSDTEYAKTHNVVGIPIILAGKGGGRVKTGAHIKGNGDPITRVGLTLQQVMGVPVDKWGTGLMQTSKSVSEIIA